MKVKELIKLLSELDQEKEIKTVMAGGYECEEETADIEVVPYKNVKRCVTNWQDHEDFYLIDAI